MFGKKIATDNRIFVVSLDKTISIPKSESNIRFGSNNRSFQALNLLQPVTVGENCYFGPNIQRLGPNVEIGNEVTLDINIKDFGMTIKDSHITESKIETWHIGRDYIDKDIFDVTIGKFVDLAAIPNHWFAVLVYSGRLFVEDGSVLTADKVVGLLKARQGLLLSQYKLDAPDLKFFEPQGIKEYPQDVPLRIVITREKSTIETLDHQTVVTLDPNYKFFKQ